MIGVLRGRVPVPDLPPRPEQIEFAQLPVLVMGGLAAALIIVFTWHVCAVIIGRSRSQNPFRTAIILGAPAIALVVAAGITDTAQRHLRDQQIDRWGDLQYAAMTESVAALEHAYGITLTQSPPFVPVVPRDWPSEQPVTLADGTATTCWFATTDGHYAVTCGDTENTATPLQPVAP
ncbi:hypothetical protein LFM56_15780 [Cellulomonas iranensis]|uniref:hypothetical protein n=1 Tax=Cellulomonas iranensis TaxID=76862 RepID=UPI001CF11C74|nr:hypothetical protein [Cellulomonas iranensis]UCN14315.1 hypothetical protein LFM56_15780 [Cellulomonas iranensis]